MFHRSLLIIIFGKIVQSSLLYNVDSTFPLQESIVIKGTGICTTGYFLCNSTTQCVPQRMNCDGQADCDDGSDEWNCDDVIGDSYWDHLFRKQPYGRSDDIPLGKCYWENFNHSCECRGNDILCRMKGFKELPSGLPKNDVAMLDLSGNSFDTLTRNFFKNLPHVDILVLKFCSIKIIESYAFEMISKIFVETLYLDENKIEYLPENLFPYKNWLKLLILSGNRINVLHSYDFLNLDVLQELDLRGNKIITFSEEVFQPLRNLETLYLNENHIKAITPGMLPQLIALRTLSLANNQIHFVMKKSFDLPSLKHLFLSGNQLKEIENQTFCGIPNLHGLNLDNNLIENFQLEAFMGVENLTSLVLKENQFKTLNESVLENLINLNHIYFSSFHLCRAALHVRVCHPNGDGISSREHLLDNTILRGSVWIMASIGIFGNLVVLFGRYFNNSRSHVEHSLYLRHLAASDLLMGIYLAAIASADITFRGEYIIHEEEWRKSVMCSICGFLSTLSCQSSTLLLSLVTWDRLVSVTQPLQPRTSGKGIVAFRLIALWGLSVAAAAAPFSQASYFGNNFYGNNGVCLSLHIHDPYAKGWEYSAGLFILINTCSLVFITISYLRMFQAIRGSGEAMRSTLSGRENIVARRFAVIVATDCACWFPIIIVKLVALAGIKISPSLYAWLAVLVLPVNSALNPVLYTLTTASFKQQVIKYLYALSCKATVESRSQTGYESALSLSLGHFSTGSGRKRLLQRRISYV